MRTRQRIPEPPAYKVVYVRDDIEIVSKLEAIALSEGCSVVDIVRRAIREYLQRMVNA